MRKTKRLLSLVVVFAMMLSMIPGINIASAATTEVDLFEALKNRSIYAVANSNGYTEQNLSIRDTGRALAGNTDTCEDLFDISAIPYDAETKTLTDCDALSQIITKIQATQASRTADQIKNVIIYAKMNGRNYITDYSDGPFMLTTATDGTTTKDVWFTAPFARYRAASNGGDATYDAQLVNPIGPYFVATSDILKGSNELTFIIEFLDKGTAGASMLYAKAGGGNAAVSLTGVGTNTGKWKTVAVSVTDADIAANNDGNTGMKWHKDDFRIQNTSMSISRIMICKTSDYEAVLAGEELPFDPTFITDWYQYAVDNNGVYVDASKGAVGTGISAVNNETAAQTYDNKLYDITKAEDLAIVQEKSPAGLANAQSNNLKYVCPGGADGAWMFREATSSDGVKKMAMFGTRYATARNDWAKICAGAYYFKITDNLTQADKDLTIIVEYLDEGTANIDIGYMNSAFVNGSGKPSTTSAVITRTNTKTWKQAAIHVKQAYLTPDLTKTALADHRAAIKVQFGGVDTYISKFAIVRTPKMEEEKEEPLPEIPLDQTKVRNDGVDWFNVAKEKGAYIEAENGATGTGIFARCKDTTNEDTQLLDLSVDADELIATSNATLNTNIIQTGLEYATLHTSDGAWMYKTFKDVGTETKNTFFTTKYVTPLTDATKKIRGGNVYFELDSDKITSSDKALYIVVEFLDRGTDPFKIEYTTDKLSDGKYQGAAITVPKKDTNYWRTAIYRVDNANFGKDVTNTPFGSGKQQLRINSNGVDTYISRVAVVKASDIDVKEPIAYVAPEKAGAAPTIWIAGDSTVETLDPGAFPREGWGMEIANFFKEKTYTSTTGVDANGNAANVNDGVTVVNRAKGGKSTRTFLSQLDPTVNDSYYDTRWDDIKKGAKKGDYLFVNFGINDTNNRVSVMTHPFVASDLEDGTSHRANMYEFMRVAKEKGLNLVLLTATHGRVFNGDTVKADGVENHREAMKQFGLQYGIPVIDIDAYQQVLMNELGAEGSRQFFCHGSSTEWPGVPSWVSLSDNTHISQAGARQVCKFIVEDIEKQAAAGVPSMVALEKWIDKTEERTRLTKPKAQSETYVDDTVYDISNVSYTVDGVASDVYAKGEVTTTLTVKNNGNADSDAVLYSAVYDVDGILKDIAKSEVKSVAKGASVTLTTGAVTVPDLDGVKVRKFVWNSKLNPYKGEASSKYVINADGYNRRAVITWETREDDTGYTYDVYRDNGYIGTTTKGTFIDEQVKRGNHSYQVNVYKDGVLEYQTGYAIASVTSLYDFQVNSGALYTKANVDAYGSESDIRNNLQVLKTNKLYAPNEAKSYFTYLTDAQISSATTAGRFITNGSDGPVNIVKAKDADGKEKEAWFTTGVKVYGNATADVARDGNIYFKVLNSAVKSTDKNLTIYVEYLSEQPYLTLQYMNGSTTSASQAVVNSTPGKWSTARFILTDAYFDQSGTLFFDKTSDFRFPSGGTPLYISSVLIVKGDVADANTVIAQMNNKDFHQSTLKPKADKYADGVSIDFSTGEAVENGISNFMITTGNPDALGAIEQDVDGKYYATTKAAVDGDGYTKQTYLYFDVDDDYMFGAADNKFIIEIEYQAPVEMDINLMVPKYDKEKGTATANANQTLMGVAKSGEGEWLTLTKVIDGAVLLSGDNAGCDFRLFTPAWDDEPNRQLRVRKVTIKNAEHIGAKVASVSEEKDSTTIHIAADSIAANYTAAQTAESGIMGWGQVINDYLNRVTINNKATPGASTVTFGNMGSILNSVQEGDYVLISFGHNDQMSNKWVEVEDYKNNLKSWIKQIRAKQGVPVLVTMIPQVSKSAGTLIESASFDERRAAVAEVANETGVMLVKLGEQMFADEDAGKFTTTQYSAMYCKEQWNNTTHLAESGCRYVAQIIVESLAKQSKRFATFVK